jgi:hypothetical protein
MRALTICFAALLLPAACGGDADTSVPDAGTADPDPLDLASTATPGSLDELHERIISQRCSGEPGLCHNGQFEPNLSTPALTFAYLVNRPGIEKDDRLRVKPGDPGASLLIDKIRNRNGVATQMPLGAEPLDEADIAELEKWITDGALREPAADPIPVLNNPPRRPEIGIFNGNTRLDGTGPINVSPGTTLTLRHTVQDFETADSAIPFAAVILGLGDGNDVVLNPAATDDPHVGQTQFDSLGPQGKGDQLDYKLDWTIPATLEIRNQGTGARTTRAAAGQTVTILAVYIDGATPGIVAIDFSTTPIQIQ